MYQVLDLFSGAGGMAEGFLQSGFSIPFASDRSEQAAVTYQNRHRQLGLSVKYFCGDVSILSEPENLHTFLGDQFNRIDVICGGPPCQGFSLAGRRNPFDERNKLVQSYIKILAQVKPKYFVMENVLGILSAFFVDYIGEHREYYDEKVLDVLLSEFKSIGYTRVKIKVLDASDFGVPQKRQRVIFLGTRDDIQNELHHPMPLPQCKITAKEALDDLVDIDYGSVVTKYNSIPVSNYQRESREGRTWDSNGNKVSTSFLYNHETSKHSHIVISRFSLLKQGENVGKMIQRIGHRNIELQTKKQNCRRIIESEPSYTVLTLPDDLIHYSKNRILTVREMARLQSFDDSFEFLGKRTTGGHRRKQETPQYTLVGNAVPPLLAKAVASEIMKNLTHL